MSGITHSLRYCACIRQVRELHAQILARGTTHFLANHLVQAYGRCGCPEEARMVFDREIQEPSLFSWNIMIQAYARNGYAIQAMDLFHRMRQRDVVTWTCIATMCMHANNKRDGLAFFYKMPQRNAVTWNVLLAANAQNADDYVTAKRIFDSMPARTIISWNTILRALQEPSLVTEIFGKMPARDGVSWDLMTCRSHSPRHWFDDNPMKSHVSWNILQARTDQLDHSKYVYGRMPAHGILSCTNMIQAYCSEGDIDRAKNMFDSMHARNLVTWNTMISGFLQTSHAAQAQAALDRAPQRDVVSWSCMFQAVANAGALSDAKAAFDEMPEKNVVSWTGLLLLYARADSPVRAKAAFDRMPKHDLAGWNALVTSYARNGHLETAKEVFEHLMPEKGLWSCSCLIDAYSRHGQVQEAKELFDNTCARDASSWNSMMEAYAFNGQCTLAIELFCEMQLSGISPDAISFTTILAACSHLGCPQLAQHYLVSMPGDYGLKPDQCHYVCAIDNLGRAGSLSHAQELVSSMPYFKGLDGNSFPLRTLLGACRNHGDRERGLDVAVHALELDPEWPSLYSLLMESLTKGL